jgi:hypothetical protein
MSRAFSFVGEIVASNSAAVAASVLIAAALVVLVCSGVAARVALRLEEKLSD